MSVVHKGSQISFEFIMLVGFALLISLVIVVFIGFEIKDTEDIKEYELVRDYAGYIQTELFLAAQVKSGYSRQFTTINEIEGINFSASLNNNKLYVKSNRHIHILTIPTIKGQLDLGVNNITNKNGVVFLNE